MKTRGPQRTDTTAPESNRRLVVWMRGIVFLRKVQCPILCRHCMRGGWEKFSSALHPVQRLNINSWHFCHSFQLESPWEGTRTNACGQQDKLGELVTQVFVTQLTHLSLATAGHKHVAETVQLPNPIQRVPFWVPGLLCHCPAKKRQESLGFWEGPTRSEGCLVVF